MEDVVMNTVFDFAPLWRSGVGFDRLFDVLDQAGKWEPADNYPPYNIEKTGDDTYRITLAVAGLCLTSSRSRASRTCWPSAARRPRIRADLICTRGLPAARSSGASVLPNTSR